MGAGAAAGERADPGQLSAAEPFQEGSASGRDIAEIVGNTGFVERPHRAAAASHAHELAGLRQLGNLAGECEGSLAEGRCLEGAKRAIPQYGLDLREAPLEVRHVLRAEIEDHGVGRNFANLADLPIRPSIELLGHYHVDRQQDLPPAPVSSTLNAS